MGETAGLIDLNDGYGGVTLNGFWLQYGWSNNYKPRSYALYTFDASEKANADTTLTGNLLVDYQHLGQINRRWVTAGKMTISSTIQVDGTQITIPTLCTNATCSSDFEFNCNEWSTLHQYASNIKDEERQLYTDSTTNGETDKIYRSAAGWSARGCSAAGWLADDETTLYSGDPFSGNNADTEDYAGILQYDNDLALRRDWNNNPVKVYEAFDVNASGTISINANSTVASKDNKIMLCPVNVRISR